MFMFQIYWKGVQFKIITNKSWAKHLVFLETVFLFLAHQIHLMWNSVKYF